MTDEQRKPPSVVTPYRMTSAVALKRIREIANTPGGVAFGNHARERMLERDIDDVDTLRVLREGDLSGEPEPAEPGEWKCKVTRQIRGARTVGVIIIILKSKRLFVKTVEWEDL